jgi:hypothetical protein
MAEVAEQPVVVAAPETPSRLSDDAKIVSAVQAHLEAFSDVVADEPVAEAPVAEVVTEETPIAEAPVVVEEKPVEAAPAAPVAEESTLPAAYVRSAKARGWTDAEIVSFSKTNPELALKTLERMHTSRVSEVQEWAELGRRVRQGGNPIPAQAQVAQPAMQSQTGLQPINVQEMVEKYGNEDLIKALAGPVNAAISMLDPLVQNARVSQVRAQQAQMETLGKTVQEFFTAGEMKPYAEVYGKSINALTAPQVEMRSKVLETADALIAGAAFQGRQLSVPEALSLAHDSVASGLKENIIRETIRTSVQKRARSLTLKPTAQGRPAVGGPPRDRAELLTRTEDRLAGAFR